MSGLLFALALFGCSDDASFCERLETTAPTYHSRAACMAGMGEALGSDTALRADYPSVIANCLDTRELAMLGKAPVDLSGRTPRLARRNGSADTL